MTTTAGPLATERQLSYLADLRAKRDPQGEIVPLDNGCLDKATASRMIDALLAVKPQRVTSTPTPAAPAAEVPAGVVPVGTFTIVRKDGSYRTLQIGPAKWADGKLVASYLSGPDNELSYTGFAFVDGVAVRPWKRFREDSELMADLQFLLEDANRDEAHELFLDEAERYALASGRCMRCGHKLTVPASLHRGLGPVCAGLEGV
jgi:hypothetical protein